MFKKLNDRLEDVILISEAVIAFLLAILVFVGIAYLAIQFWETIIVDFPKLGSHSIHKVLDLALIIFITIELFRIAIAYMEKEGVLLIVIEAAFVAVSRKFVLYEYKLTGLNEAIALSILLIALAITYFALRYKEDTGLKNSH